MFDVTIAGLSGADLGFLLASALVAGLARGFSGFGAALIFVPLASSTIGPKLAVPLLLAIDFPLIAFTLLRAWPLADRPGVARMSIGALAGVPLGAYLLINASPLAIRWSIAVLIALLLPVFMSGWRYHGRPHTAATIGVGALAGFLTGFAGVGGPPVVAYWLGGTFPRHVARANFVLFFAGMSVMSVVSFTIGGLFTPNVFVLGPLTLPFYALGMYVGSRLFRIASEANFRRVCYTLIAVAAIVSLPVLDGVLGR